MTYKNLSLNDLPDEVWMDFIGYEGYYQISNFGRLKSLRRIVIDTIGRRLTVRGRILKQHLSADGYPKVSLSKNGALVTYKTHRPVALHFIENTANKSDVNHIDGVKTNNHISNLEWNTSQENMRHAYDTGLKEASKGARHCNSKLTVNDILAIRKMRQEGLRQWQIAERFFVARTTVRDILSRKIWAHVA